MTQDTSEARTNASRCVEIDNSDGSAGKNYLTLLDRDVDSHDQTSVLPIALIRKKMDIPEGLGSVLVSRHQEGAASKGH
jgi:hypothetical protein